ncbi:MAG: hypothetical protein KAH17_02845 [Bacteroidales bacterium]|nr:hypothetical protein [Bacteroidales bacterium]
MHCSPWKSFFWGLPLLLLLVGCGKMLNYGNYCVDPPAFAIYKTNGDYFHLYSTWLSKDGDIDHLLDVSYDETIVYHFEGDSGYHFRIPLDSNYFLGGEITVKDVFTGITFTEYHELFYLGELGKLDSLLEHNIIDDDPFSSYYTIPFYDAFEHWDSTHQWDTLSSGERNFRQLSIKAKEINKIIQSGELDQYFKKLK